METVLRVTDVAKSFGDVRAVDGVSFGVRKGTITGLLGRNGAGKTTTPPDDQRHLPSRPRLHRALRPGRGEPRATASGTCPRSGASTRR